MEENAILDGGVVLCTHALTKNYGSKVAVSNLDMTIKRGDIYGFIGKNGAGKTTALRMIVGTALPTSGSVELFGGEPLNMARRKIGSLIEAPGIYSGCSAKENMRRLALLCGGTDSEIDDILKLVGLSYTGSKKAGAFSLGMKQRLGIGMALLGNPEFMVLDEPINGLDPEGIKAIRDLVIMLNKERGITFLISSHLLDELAKVVTRYGIIREGVLVEEISAEELKGKITDGLVVTVDDVQTASNTLSGFVPDSSIRVKDNSILFAADVSRAAEINCALVSAGVKVSRLFPHAGKLEEYFIERMG